MGASVHRRNLLKSVAAVPLLSLLPASASAKRTTKHVVHARVRSSDPAWPSAASWAKLNDTVGGNLIEPHALFAACETEPKGAACADVMKNIRNPFYVGDQPAGTEVSGWLDAWMPQPSAYAVRARNATDVAAAINFGRENNLRLVVKGAAHSYQGTSNAPDSLLIWMRGMNNVTLHDSFVPRGCEGKVAPSPSVATEAGAVWIDAYDAVTTKAGRYVQGGGCTDVGVAGLIQSGGFGSCSKGFGTAAAGLLEAEIVTADGRVRTVNACNDPELFWAIKGGGGGSWGVVTKLTLRTHDLPEFFGYAGGKITAKSDEAFRQLVTRFVAFYSDNLFNPHWGESVKIEPGNTLELSMMCQGLDRAQAKAAWQPFFDWVNASKDYSADGLHVGVTEARHWWDIEGNPAMTRDLRPGAPKHHAWWNGDQDQVSAFLHGYDSLWLPASLLHAEQQQQLADVLFAASRHFEVQLHFNKGLGGAPSDAIAASRDTATNPAVLDAFALAIIATGGPPPPIPGVPLPPYDDAKAHANARAVDAATTELRKVAPAGGSYVSESNYFNSSWQNAFWGGNYPKLRALKAKYDPDGLFFVHHGVGSEEWNADGFTRLATR